MVGEHHAEGSEDYDINPEEPAVVSPSRRLAGAFEYVCILELFAGISPVSQACSELDVPVWKHLFSEVGPDAICVSTTSFPFSIPLGSIKDVNEFR